MPDFSSYTVIGALLIFIAASIWLGAQAQKRIEKKSFLSGYFLGNRGLGAWTMALTATVQSGGTFMGFPSLVYTYGWIVAFWIAGYMIVPLTGFAVIGKRMAQLSRRSGAITVPDLFRERFNSTKIGLIASLLILVFMSTMMIAQFKAGAIVMKLAWPGNAAAMAEREVPEDPTVADEGLTEAVASDDNDEIAETPALAPAAAPAVAGSKPAEEPKGEDWPYLIGLGVFALTVVGYTLIGGFLASVWTDLFQSVMMVIGVIIMLCLAIPAAGGMKEATMKAVKATGPGYASGPGYQAPPKKVEPVEGEEAEAETEPPSVHQFLTPGLAVSFFFIWVLAGIGSPASMVRVMATQSTEVLRKSVFLLSFYNCLIYIPLIMIFICARAIIPHLDKPDEIVPQLALTLTSDIPGGGILTGLILAAPFGAVMATVSCYLLVIASGLIKDIYLRFINPAASPKKVRYMTYGVMIAVGLMAIALNIRPVKFLQALVVFSGASAAATFVVPALMLTYWRRATAAGTIAAMLAGTIGMFGLYSLGWIQRSVSDAAETGLFASIRDWLGPAPGYGIATSLSPFYLWGLDPIMWSLLISAIAGIVVSLMTTPPDQERVDRFFLAPDALEPKPLGSLQAEG